MRQHQGFAELLLSPLALAAAAAVVVAAVAVVVVAVVAAAVVAVAVVVVAAAISLAAPGMPDSHPTWSVAQMERVGHHYPPSFVVEEQGRWAGSSLGAVHEARRAVTQGQWRGRTKRYQYIRANVLSTELTMTILGPDCILEKSEQLLTDQENDRWGTINGCNVINGERLRSRGRVSLYV